MSTGLKTLACATIMKDWRVYAPKSPFAFVNAGEYLDLRGKHQLLEHRAVDILNVHGRFSHVMHAAWLTSEYGIPISLGNTACEMAFIWQQRYQKSNGLKIRCSVGTC